MLDTLDIIGKPSLTSKGVHQGGFVMFRPTDAFKVIEY
jgi:hypothetical protein